MRCCYFIRFVMECSYVDYLLSKLAKGFSCLMTVYCSIVRSVREFACSVRHPGITMKLSNKVARVQKRFEKFPKFDYSATISQAQL